ncbi:uncharacterized protein LOC120421257 isoform X2 [Culex pipiens pallens]|nr:uncharacterized protein LOC120421257 isoform X2 [Culex pipiens pallens]
MVATGWGNTGFAQKRTPTLLKVSLKPISNEQCSEFYPPTRRIRQGLQDQHLCAVDEEMDTCEGDSGGPLQLKLLHNSRMTPFVVGVTSFGGVCGTSNPGVYAKVAFFYDWIMATMRDHGADGLEVDYNATLCALRYASLREFDDQVRIDEERSNNFTAVDMTRVRISSRALPIQMVDVGHNCYGVIVDEDTVITVADCTNLEGQSLAFVTYLGEKVMPISKIHVHPNHVQGSGYNNIAILKMSKLLDLPLGFQPSCVWHGMFNDSVNAYGSGRQDINHFLYFDEEIHLNSTQALHRIKSPVLNESSCVISERFAPRLRHGLTREQFCVGNDVFLVPGSCDLLVGGVLDEWMFKENNDYHHTVALSLFGRDCGFGEHIIGVRLSSHVEWMKSVLLPNYQNTADTVRYIDMDLHEGDNCTISKGRPARCVSVDICPGHLNRKVDTFCSSTSVVCCAYEIIMLSEGSQIHPEVLKCPEMAQGHTTSLGSLAYIARHFGERITFLCSGVVITKSAVLTTASCLAEHRYLVVRLIDKQTQYNISDVLKHETYNSTDKTNDIALIKLSYPFEWNAQVFPACLWTNQTHTPIVLNITFAVRKDVTVNTVLHPMYNSDCQRSHPYEVHKTQLCLRNPMKNITCVRFSGMLTWLDPRGVPFLVGVNPDEDVQCIQWRYSTATRISSFLEWITKNAFI